MRKLLLLSGILAALSLPTFAQARKKRVAVLNFDYSTVQSNAAAIFGSNNDIGKGIADLLVEKLVNSGQYSVVERKQIDKIMAEQNFSNSDRADAATAAKLGKLLGVDAMIMGSITQFGRDDKTTNVGGGALTGGLSKYGIGGVGHKNSKAVVGISARMVNTDTAEILAVKNGKGESTRSGTGLLGSGGSSGTAIGGMVDMKSSNFANTIIGEAVTKAVNDLGAQLDSVAQALPTKTVVVEGLVADATGDTVVINVGSRAGVKVGDRLSIRRATREIRDPASGKVIRRVEDSVGDIAITEVDEASAVGKFTGAGKPKVGDAVKSAQ
ncbi:MAG TPA: CsgG/HfaB family protein [Bryobacteraceae bacterium]|nr:CsgG/HfaB family protein [Bryobacteraceae bacterium]